MGARERLTKDKDGYRIDAFTPDPVSTTATTINNDANITVTVTSRIGIQWRSDQNLTRKLNSNSAGLVFDKNVIWTEALHQDTTAVKFFNSSGSTANITYELM